MAAKIEPLLTIEDLEACPDDSNRYELIGGELFVSRAPAVEHQLIVQNIQKYWLAYLERKLVGTIVASAGAVLDQHDAVIPDLVFVQNERWSTIVRNGRFVGPPDIVVEVVSPGIENQRRDRSVKRQLYAKYGVREYWIVDSENRSIDIHRLAGANLKLICTLQDRDEVTSPLLPEFRLQVSMVFICPAQG